MPRHINEEGLALIKGFEELRLVAYDDRRPHHRLVFGDVLVGVCTIGWGHTRNAFPGQEITPAQAENYLREDLADAETETAVVVTVPLNDNEFSALVSFEFNTGGLMLATKKGAPRPSRLLASLNEGDRMNAAAEFDSWIYDGRKRLDGLKRRRAAEKALFLKPVGG